MIGAEMVRASKRSTVDLFLADLERVDPCAATVEFDVGGSFAPVSRVRARVQPVQITEDDWTMFAAVFCGC